MDDIDAGLIQKCKRGNVNAFESLVIKYEKMVFNMAYRMLSDIEMAKDVSQEVFIKVYKNISSYEEVASFSTWLYRITYNACIDQLRKTKNKETISMDRESLYTDTEVKLQIIDSDPTPEEKYLQKEKALELQKAIDCLSDEHKTMIVLRDIKGLSYSDISDITGISIGTVKSRISRARISLKNILKKNTEQNKPENV